MHTGKVCMRVSDVHDTGILKRKLPNGDVLHESHRNKWLTAFRIMLVCDRKAGK